MTASPTSSPHDADAPGTDPATPPPGCPAHAGAVHLSGTEHRTDPMGLYERLRDEYGSVAPVLVDGDLPAWLVLGYRENLEVVRTPNRFTRDSRHWGSLNRGEVAPDSPLLPMVGWQPLAAFLDGDEHQRLRSAVTDSLGRLDRRGIRRHVTRYAEQLIAEFAADGEADLIEQFAEQLPMLVMTQLLGMPEEYGPRLVDATLDLVRGTETAFESNRFVVETLEAQIPRKREQPGRDVTSWLMGHPAELTDEEVVQHLRLLLAAANENTTVCLSNTLRLVLTDHRFRASLAGARMTLPDAVEQVLWDEPPTMVCPGRWATGDTELGGHSIKAGDMLLLGFASGNVDPAVRPDLNVPMHGNRSHLAFSSGPHECPGQDIGRAITETAVDVLLAALPGIHLAVEDKELAWVSSWHSRHLTALPVQFPPRLPDPAAAAAESRPTGRAAAPVRATAPGPETSSVTPAAAVPAAAAPAAPKRRWWRRLPLLRSRG